MRKTEYTILAVEGRGKKKREEGRVQGFYIYKSSQREGGGGLVHAWWSIQFSTFLADIMANPYPNKTIKIHDYILKTLNFKLQYKKKKKSHGLFFLFFLFSKFVF